jgi:hypothetical protein
MTCAAVTGPVTGKRGAVDVCDVVTAPVTHMHRGLLLQVRHCYVTDDPGASDICLVLTAPVLQMNGGKLSSVLLQMLWGPWL